MTFSTLGTDTLTKQPVHLYKASRTQGLYIVGLQGMGKSGLIENLIMQDIDQQIGVCVLDPHGELIDHVIARLPGKAEEEKVIYLHLADEEYPFGLNLFECSNSASDSAIMKPLRQVLHVFEKAFGVSQPSTPRIYDYLFNSAYTLIANPEHTLIDIPLLFNDTCRQKLLANIPSADVLKFWNDVKQLPQQEQYKEEREVLRRLNDLSHAPLRNIVGQSRSTINLQKIMDEGKILLVKLDRQLEQATSLIGSIFVALILNASAARPSGKRNQFHLYADEFQRFATEDFATLLEEARKAGIGITMAHQNRAQLELSDKQADKQLKARTLNVGSLVVFRVPTDANALAGQFQPELQPGDVEYKPKMEPLYEYKNLQIWDTPGLEKEWREKFWFFELIDNLLQFLAIYVLDRFDILQQHFDKPSPQLQYDLNYANDNDPAVWQEAGIDFALLYFDAQLTKYLDIVQKLRLFLKEAKEIQRFTNTNSPYSRNILDPNTQSIKVRKYLLTHIFFIPQGKHWVYTQLHNPSQLTYTLPDDLPTKIETDLESYIKSYVKGHKEAAKAIDSEVVTHPLETFAEALLNGTQLSNGTYYPGLKELKRTAVYKVNPSDTLGLFIFSDTITPRVQEFLIDYLLSLEKLLPVLAQKLKELRPHFIFESKKVPTGEYHTIEDVYEHTEERGGRYKYDVNVTDARKTRYQQVPGKQASPFDAEKRLAQELVNLPKYTARVKLTDAKGSIVEYTLQTLKPETGLYGKALQERIERIQQQNISDGYIRERAKVEDEIRHRQSQCNQQAPQSPMQPPHQPPQLPPQQPRARGSIVCQTCKANNRHGAQFCKQCGGKI